MKKVFLSLAVITALTVVSCKQADAPATDAADTTAVETVEVPAEVAVDSPAVAVDSPAVAAPAAAPAK